MTSPWTFPGAFCGAFRDAYFAALQPLLMVLMSATSICCMVLVAVAWLSAPSFLMVPRTSTFSPTCSLMSLSLCRRNCLPVSSVRVKLSFVPPTQPLYTCSSVSVGLPTSVCGVADWLAEGWLAGCCVEDASCWAKQSPAVSRNTKASTNVVLFIGSLPPLWFSKRLLLGSRVTSRGGLKVVAEVRARYEILGTRCEAENGVPPLFLNLLF